MIASLLLSGILSILGKKIAQVIYYIQFPLKPVFLILTFGDDQSFVLKTKEFMPGTPPLTLYRELTCQGKISNDGQVQFAWPESWWELGETTHDLISRINLHTGYVISGHAINNNTGIFTGNYDGDHFNADFRVNAYQEKPGTMPVYQEVVDGPIKFSISFELQKIL